MRFDANKGTTTNNPMSGHAIGPDIHPYSLGLLPIMAY